MSEPNIRTKSQRLQDLREGLDSLQIVYDDEPERLENTYRTRRLIDRLEAGGPENADNQIISVLERLVQSGSAWDISVSTILHEQGAPQDLERTITSLQCAVDMTPDIHTSLLELLNNLGNGLNNRFKRHGTLDDLEAAISANQQAVDLAPDGHPDKAGWLTNLGAALQLRFEWRGNLDDLEAAISAKQQAVDLTPDGHPHKAHWLNNLGNALQSCFERRGNLDDLEAAISANQQAVDLAPDGHPDKAGWLTNLGAALQLRFEWRGNLDDLEAAISAKQQAVDLTPDGHPHKAHWLNNLGNALQSRFERRGNLDDLEAAISANQQAVDLAPDGHPDKAGWLTNLGAALQLRFERRGNLDDLEAATSANQQAVDLVPDGHPHKAAMLSNLGAALQLRFERRGNLDDLEAATSANQQAVDLVPDGHPHKATMLSNLGAALQSRFERRGNLDDLEAAISANQQAVDLTPDGHPHKAGWLSNLGIELQLRFKRCGNLDDLEAAISVKQQAVDLMPDGHPHKAKRLTSLGGALQRRFEQRGNLDDLEAAISANQHAVDLTPDGHPHKADWLSNLGNALQLRFERRGNLDDLEAAISANQQAVDLTPDGYPDKATVLSNLGAALQSRFERRGNFDDLEAAISANQQTVDLTPDGHPHKAGWLSNLGAALQSRFKRRGNLDDLEAAISANQQAVDLAPDGHPDKAGWLTNLGNALQSRFERRGNLDDLEAAISANQQAVDLTPDGHPDKAGWLSNLGAALQSRFQRLGDPNDMQHALLAAQESAESVAASFGMQLKGALLWASYCALGSSSPLPAFELVISLLPRCAWLGLSANDQYFQLAKFGSATRNAVAAAVAEAKYVKAIEWAEQGRSIVWQNLLSLRTPLDGLRAQYPELARRLYDVSQHLERPLETQNALVLDGPEWSRSRSADSRITLAMERDRLVDEIRSKPGFGGFMKPKPLEQLAPAVRDGPVVFLNLGQDRCDALALRADDNGVPEVVPIPLERVTIQSAKQLSRKLIGLLSASGVRTRDDRGGMLQEDIRDKDEIFKEILQTLWLDYVKPVVDALEYSVNLDSPPRLWWCTTGELAFLPLHAAGDYYAGEVGQKLSDYVVSSYTPTITALLDRSLTHMGDTPKILAVAMSKTHEATPLPKTEEEVKNLQLRAAKLQVVALMNETATKKRMLEELKKSSWAHLACHGKQIGGKPMESGLLLHDGKLELSEIIKAEIPNADFAFLSACQTAVGDEGVPEESAHLAAGMLFAGYRGVVATMWSIRDDIAPRVAESVYQHLLAGEQPKREEAAYALHKAVRSLQEGEESFTSWVPFIYIGR